MTKEKLLVVEDQPDIQSLLKIYFTLQGYDVVTASCGAEAIRLIPESKPDLALLDVNLPDMEGYDIGRHMRANPRTDHIPIIFLTARGDRRDRLIGLGEIQAQYFITKPFDIEEVHVIVKNCLHDVRRRNSTHPITHLPIADVVNERLRTLLSNDGWALALLHINGFQTFSQFYGVMAGENVLKAAAQLLTETIGELGKADDFIGQMVVGPDFLVISTPDHVRAICERIITRFDNDICLHYNYKHRKQGYIEILDDDGELRQVSLMSISIGVLTSNNGPFYDIHDLSETVEEVRQKAVRLAREQGLGSFVHYGRLLNQHELEDIARRDDLALVAISINAHSDVAYKLLSQGVLTLPNAQQISLLGISDMAVVVPSSQVEQDIEQTIERFYNHALVRHGGDAMLTFGWAQGPHNSVDDMIVAVARDMLERCASQGVDSLHELAIFQLEPQRIALQKRYEQACRLYDAYEEEQRVFWDASEQPIRAEIGDLTAVVDHDLGSVLGALTQTIAYTAQQTEAHAALTRLSRQLTICIAWKRSMVELGTGNIPQPRLLDISDWLADHLHLLNEQLDLGLNIELQKATESQQSKLDPELLLVACMHMILAAHAAGAHWLRATVGPLQSDDGFVLKFEDDGKTLCRMRMLQYGGPTMLQNEPNYSRHSLKLLRHVLHLQGIGLRYQQEKTGFHMIWDMPGTHSESAMRIVPLCELEDEVIRIEQEVACLEALFNGHDQSRERALSKADKSNTDRLQQLLLPYVEELDHHIQVLFNEAASFLQLPGMDTVPVRRMVRLSLYSRLLVRNLALVLQGNTLPVEEVDINDEIQQVLDLLEHKLADINISLDLFDHLPPVAMAAVESKQVLMNVLKNVAEATKNHGELYIKTRRWRSFVIIEIRDSGIGILPENRNKIFQLKFSTKGKGTNSGVGLFAVQSIVGRAGGRIRVASAAMNGHEKLLRWKSGFSRHPYRWNRSGTLFQLELPIVKDGRDDTKYPGRG
ncbi:MAG: response regulator [Chloroflexales bacterium]|nr:response regulator [Chloroflexales bacterium]